MYRGASPRRVTMSPLIPLILLILGVSVVYCVSWQLTFYFTTTWDKDNSRPPAYSVVGTLDDVAILSYSDGAMQRLFPWMEKVDARHWESLNGIAKHYEGRHQHTIQRLSSDHSRVYVYQVRFGCELFEDNTTYGVEEFGAHGRPFIYLDNLQKRFMVAVNDDITASALVEEWNRRQSSVRRQVYYKDTACIEWLRDYLKHKEDHLLENVRPEVKVWGHQSDEVTTLHCLAYGFHPRDIEVKWIKNRRERMSTNETSPVLPHPDGTYQTRVSILVPTREGDSYSCHVDHSSLDQPLTVRYNRIKGGKNLTVCWIVLLSALSVPLVIFLVLIIKGKVQLSKWAIGVTIVLYVVVAVVILVVYMSILGRENKAYTEPD